MAGPRDWAPEEPAGWLRPDDPAWHRYSSAQRGARSQIRGVYPTSPVARPSGTWGLAVLSLIAGSTAIWLAVAPLVEASGNRATGYALSSVGVAGALLGLNALRRNRFVPHLGVLVLAVAGIGAGVIGTVAMLGLATSAHAPLATGNGLPLAAPAGISGQAAARTTHVSLSGLSIAGRGGEDEAVVGNGGTVRLEAGYSVRSTVTDPQIDVHLERRSAGGSWTPTGVNASVAQSAPLSAVTPAYSTRGVRETVQYRFASTDSTSAPVSVVYENQQYYSGMAATIYRFAEQYCPTTAVHIASLGGREAGDYTPGTLLIRVDARVGVSVNIPTVTQRSLAIHECSHELQWVNYGGTHEGNEQMVLAAAEHFAQGANGAPGLEHAADCGAMAVEPNGYLGYGGYCTSAELADATRLLDGQRY